jgi:nucleotide-binding universal stress UspA family protein
MPKDHGRREIVVGVDGSSSSDSAVQWAAREADLRDLTLHLVHVVTPLTAPGAAWSDALMPATYARNAEERAYEIVEKARVIATAATTAPSCTPQIDVEVLYGAVTATLIDLSGRSAMIVTGCLGVGSEPGTLLGPVGSNLVRHARCPVAIVHDELDWQSSAPVLVGVDGSGSTDVALEIAFEAASTRRVDLIALHAWTDLSPLDMPRLDSSPTEWSALEAREEAALVARLARWEEQYPSIVVRPMVVCDRPIPRLLQEATHSQLVVVGGHARDGFAGMWLGSVSSTVARLARVPVIIARNSGS